MKLEKISRSATSLVPVTICRSNLFLGSSRLHYKLFWVFWFARLKNWMIKLTNQKIQNKRIRFFAMSISDTFSKNISRDSIYQLHEVLFLALRFYLALFVMISDIPGLVDCFWQTTMLFWWKRPAFFYHFEKSTRLLVSGRSPEYSYCLLRFMGQ